MTCPRCGNKWDVSKSPCSRCGLLVRLPNISSSAARTSTPPQEGGLQAGDMQPAVQASSGWRPMPRTSIPLSTAPPNAPRSPSNPFPEKEGVSLSSQSPSPEPLQSTSFPGTPAPKPVVDAARSTESASPGRRTDTLYQVGHEPQMGQVAPQDGVAAANVLLQRRNALLRQSATPGIPPGMDQPASDVHRPWRPSRLVTDSLRGDAAAKNTALEHQLSSQDASSLLFQSADVSNAPETLPLMPGTLLRGNRYRVQELQERQEWLEGAFEATWIAQDAQRSGTAVMIRELVVPESNSMMTQSMLRVATMALTSVGRHPHIPTLWDAFSERGRNFFVFEPIDGESLLARMRRTGHALSEQEVIECCLQMTEVLELLAQQSPPLVHGFIRPEHIIIARDGSQYILTNFSIVLAGGATQFIAGIDRSRLSPYTAPEFVRGIVDVRSDLYSLVATAYHAVTGNLPGEVNGVLPQAQRLNPNVSPRLDAILAKGLRPAPSQRYQRPSELRQELLSMRSLNESLLSRRDMLTGTRSEPPTQAQMLQPAPTASDSVAQILPNILAPAIEDTDEQERKLLLPRPEELPAIKERNDVQDAVFWLVGMLVCLIVLVVLSRGLF